MSSVARYRQYAADCVRQAQNEGSVDERNIMLNVALAWLRLAQQTEAADEADDRGGSPEQQADQHHWQL